MRWRILHQIFLSGSIREFKAQESPPKPAPNEGNTSTSTSFSNKINLSSILLDVKKAGGGNITIEGDKIMINLT